MYIKFNPGIYTITHKNSLKVYIGESKSVYERLQTHKDDLRNNKHKNIHLQRAYNRDGLDLFSFEVLQLCEFKDLKKWENFWGKVFHVHDDKFGYNIAPTSEDGKISLAEETKIKIGIANKGKKRSPEDRLKISNGKKGKKPSEATREILSKAQTGRKHTEETKQKISRSKSGELKPSTSKPIIDKLSGIVYNSTSEAVRLLGISRYNIYANMMKEGNYLKTLELEFINNKDKQELKIVYSNLKIKMNEKRKNKI